MSQKIEIPVSATLNAQGVEQGAQRINKVLDQAGKKKIDPVPDSAVKKMDALFQAYLKLDREMARRLKVTGQDKLGPEEINWQPVYQNAKFRAAKLARLQTFLKNGGEDFTPPQEGGGGGGRGSGWGGVAAGVAQAGMRAAGPVGGVAASAMGSGMASGFGAGLMGLVGGLAALGVGKLVGAIADHIEKAENNNVAYDRLKRTLGDVNVSFNGLKAAVKGTSEGLNVTYDEGTRLATMFAKEGNVRGGYGGLPGELGLGVGLSRSFGLEPEKGVGLLGQMRGVGVTRDTQESRRIALLIGETIAKSDAFAKADEVMEAIAGFATAQTRQSLSAANVAGYGGMFSAMVGSGIAGLDPAGSAAILGRMNAALSAGGANGEASQFFTSMVGNRMGLDPLQMQVLREGGAFATKDQMFGVGSAYTRYMGQTGPTGNQTFYDATRKLIEEKYSGDDERSKLMRAHAFGKQTGLNINQSMAMLSINPNEMGELQRVLGPNNMNGVNESGIGNASKALFGNDNDRSALARSLLARKDVKLTGEQADTLRGMADGGQATQAQKEMLAKLAAQYEQERTTGSDIRDSRAALDNIKTDMADKVVPYLSDIKKFIAYMAGDKMTEKQLREKIAKAEAKENYDGQLESASSERAKLQESRRELSKKVRSGEITPEQFAAGVKEIDSKRKDVDSRVMDATQEYKDATSGKKSSSLDTRPIDQKIADAEKANGLPAGVLKSVMQQETGGKQAYLDDPAKYHYPMGEDGKRRTKNGTVSSAFGPFGILDSTAKSPGYGVKPLADKSIDEQIRFSAEYLAARSKAAGSIEGGLAGYGEGQRYSNQVMSRVGVYQTPIPSEKSGERPGASGGGAGGGRGSSVSFEPLIVQHQDQWGREVKPPQTLQPSVRPANPNTYDQQP